MPPACPPCIAPFRPALMAIGCALLLVACGGGPGEKAASQTAAKVNRSEITVHQINFLLQQRHLPADQAAQASKEVLERLIDQELSIQKATELKVDRDAKVVQQIEAAKREIISRAYIERISSTAEEPTPDEIFNYYNQNPAIFKNRKVYKFQELIVQSSKDQENDLRSALSSAKNVGAFIDYLNSKHIKFVSNQVVKASEQLPFANLDKFQKLNEGEAIINPTPVGLQVLLLVSSEMKPVEETQVRDVISLFLLNERKNKIIANDMSALRSSAKIDYIGDFSEAKTELKNAAN